jgi:hypothetical protein
MSGSQITVGAKDLRTTTMSVYVGSVDSRLTNRAYQVAIYTDVNGQPGTFVASSAMGSLTPYAWNTPAISATLQARASYWLMFNTIGRSATVNNMAFDSSLSRGARSSNFQQFGVWPSSFGPADISDTFYSLYVSGD